MTRTEAARTNGALSHGPKTEAGKAASSRNAIKHGLTSAEIVIPGEDPRAFEVLLENICIDHGPVTVREHDLAFEMAAARWRLRRLMIMEKAVIDRELRRQAKANTESIESAEQLTPEEAYAEAWAVVAESQAMKQIHRHETRLHREYNFACAALEALIYERCRIEMKTNGVHPCTKELVDADPQQRRATAMAIVAQRPGAQPVQNEPEFPERFNVVSANGTEHSKGQHTRRGRTGAPATAPDIAANTETTGVQKEPDANGTHTNAAACIA